MKSIFVSHSKDDKTIAKKLTGKLESAGYPCYVYSRDKNHGSDEELISQCSVLILILSKSSLTSEEQINQIKLAFDLNLKIIPFKAESLDNTLTVQYFLHSLEWVDAVGDGFDEAYDILTEILEENSDGSEPIKKAKKTEKYNTTNATTKKYLTYGIIAAVVIIVLYLIFSDNKDKKDNNGNGSNTEQNANPPDFLENPLNDNEKLLVGTWKLTDYEDSRLLNPQEKQQLAQDIVTLKQNVLLDFKSDRSFERRGFTPQPQKGYWEYDNIKTKILLTPTGTDRKEEVNIINLTDKTMTFVVTETVQLQNGGTEIVTTKLSFQKQ